MYHYVRDGARVHARTTAELEAQLDHVPANYSVVDLDTVREDLRSTLGFCAGCWFYVLGRDWLVRHGWMKRGLDDSADIAVVTDEQSPESQLRSQAQR